MDHLTYPYSLPPLPYPYDSLKPSIGELTLHFHHDKHLQTYINNLNKTIELCPECKNKTLRELLTDLAQIPLENRVSIQNNAGGVYNHILYFNAMSPNGGGLPSGTLAQAIGKHFGTFEDWGVEMKQAAEEVFGSGYAWLVCDSSKNLSILKTANQDNPLSKGLFPLLTIDVWEHAYYLDRQSRRTEYIDAWLGLINWPYVQNRYA